MCEARRRWPDSLGYSDHVRAGSGGRGEEQGQVVEAGETQTNILTFIILVAPLSLAGSRDMEPRINPGCLGKRRVNYLQPVAMELPMRRLYGISCYFQRYAHISGKS